jgi:molybdenum cofactor cytidylyltransferase
MEQLKQLLPLDGQPMVRRVVQVACEAELAQVVVVVGAQAEAVEQALVGLPVEFVVNPAWAEGMSTSLRAGLDALKPEIEAALIVLADQPGLKPGLLQALAARYRATGAPIVAPYHRGRRGNPVLFDCSLFPDLLAVKGDQGGREIIARDQAAIEGLEVNDEAVLMDIDTWKDYQEQQKKGLIT